MAVRKMKAKAVRVVCNNCFQQTIGIRDETGVIKYRCSHCGALTVSKVMGRRHVQYEKIFQIGKKPSYLDFRLTPRKAKGGENRI